MVWRPPSSTRTGTLFPYPPPFRATSAAGAPAGTPSARLVSRVAAVRDCGDFVLGTACLRLLMWAMGVFVEWATRGRTHARWRRRASGTSWLAWGGGLG